jgi:uncharacterized protein
MSLDEDNSLLPDALRPETAQEPIEARILGEPAPASPPVAGGGGLLAGLWLPEDLRVPWDWVDLAILAVVAFGGTLILSVVLMAVFSKFGVTPARLRSSASDLSFFAILNQLLLSFGLLGYLAFQIRLRSESPFWQTIGWRRLDTGRMERPLAYAGLIFGAFLLEGIVTLVSNGFAPKHPLPIQAVYQDSRSALLFMAIAVLIAPVVEETVFRGYIYPVIARSFGVPASVIATGTLFGLLHAPQLWGGWAQIILLVIVGIIFTYVRAATRTVVASYVLHASYNGLQVIVFLIATYAPHHVQILR